jgi:hypothetical protein
MYNKFCFYFIDFGFSMIQNLKCVLSVLCADLFLYQNMPTLNYNLITNITKETY